MHHPEKGERRGRERREGTGSRAVRRGKDSRGKGGAGFTGAHGETLVGGLGWGETGSTGNDGLRSQNPVSDGEPRNVPGPRIMSSVNI